MATVKSLVTNILQNFFFSVQQNKDMCIMPLRIVWHWRLDQWLQKIQLITGINHI